MLNSESHSQLERPFTFVMWARVRAEEEEEDRWCSIKLDSRPSLKTTTIGDNMSAMLTGLASMCMIIIMEVGTSLSSSTTLCAECDCPFSVPSSCEPGVTLMSLDHCGCCKACARQFNEDCDLSHPCDSMKGLECNIGAGEADVRGICRAISEGRPCDYGGRVYQHGEAFQPNCKHHCTCVDGVVGCSPLCSQSFPLLLLETCAQPRLLKVPGRCCEEWVCDEERNEKPSFTPPLAIESNELPMAHWEQRHRSQISGWNVPPPGKGTVRGQCLVQTTDWSACSVSCNMGFSTRVTNDNPECRLLLEKLLCEVRPCNVPLRKKPKKGRKCVRMERAQKPVRLMYAGCVSLRRYRPRYCGECTDMRCCTPNRTHVINVRFRCEGGEKITHPYQWVDSCRCHFDCEGGLHTYFQLHNDIHTYLD
uniref:Cellular communication network factor 1 n=1 Tax=Eptatretus burgeri TaxID=7764 RepID=A0A8C4Q048_EPTBU